MKCTKEEFRRFGLVFGCLMLLGGGEIHGATCIPLRDSTLQIGARFCGSDVTELWKDLEPWHWDGFTDAEIIDMFSGPPLPEGTVILEVVPTVGSRVAVVLMAFSSQRIEPVYAAERSRWTEQNFDAALQAVHRILTRSRPEGQSLCEVPAGEMARLLGFVISVAAGSEPRSFGLSGGQVRQRAERILIEEELRSVLKYEDLSQPAWTEGEESCTLPTRIWGYISGTVLDVHVFADKSQFHVSHVEIIAEEIAPHDPAVDPDVPLDRLP